VSEAKLTKQMRLALWFSLAIAVLPLIQLIPLPPWLWTALPNRQPSAEAFAILGHAVPWMPISVSPQATWLSALSLVPPLAIFLGTLLLTYRERRLLSLVVLAVGIVSVFVGLIQVAQGPESPLRFFEVTNPTEAVGFFANRNHFAALLYCLILFATAWTVQGTTGIGALRNQKQYQYDTVSIVASIGAFTVRVMLLAGEAMARSRAGLGLTIVALFGAIPLAFSKRRTGPGATPNKKLLIVGAIALAVTFSLQFALYRILERTSDPISQDDRLVFARTTIEAAKAYMPVGSGMGTFVPVYAMFEKPQDASQSYVNRAHNDILELSLETGVLGLVLMGLFAAWLVRRSVEIWRSAPAEGANELDWSIARAATIVAALIVAHSFLDYPLRTDAMMAVMALACALLIEPPAGAEQGYELATAAERILHHARPRQELTPSPAPRRPIPLPGPSVEAADPSSSSSQGGRWGADIEWPKEWAAPASAKKEPTGSSNPQEN
jgi:O-antigen ligase